MKYYKTLYKLIDDLLDIVKDNEQHSLIPLLDIATYLCLEWEAGVL